MVRNDEFFFMLEEFGLTEDDLAAYKSAQQRQQLALNCPKQQPLSVDLQRRLDRLRQAKAADSPPTQQERDQLLRGLDTLVSDARQGWEQAFQGMTMANNDHLLDPEPIVLTKWETREWEW